MDSPSSRAPQVIAKSSMSTSPSSPDGLAVAHDAGDDLAPALVHRDPVPGHLRVPEGLRPEVEPEPPRAGHLLVALPHAGQADQGLQPLGHGGLPGQHGLGVPVELVLGPPHGLGEQAVLGAEVVDDQGRAGVGPLGDVRDPGVREAALADHLDRGAQHLLAALVRAADDLGCGFATGTSSPSVTRP